MQPSAHPRNQSEGRHTTRRKVSVSSDSKWKTCSVYVRVTQANHTEYELLWIHRSFESFETKIDDCSNEKTLYSCVRHSRFDER